MPATRPAWLRPNDIVDLTRLAVPIALSRAGMMLMGVTDVVVLGRMAPDELALVLSAWLPVGVALGFGLGILLGVQVLTSELVGVGKRDHTGRIFRRGMLHALIIGAVATLLIVPLALPLFRGLAFEDEIAHGTASVTRIIAFGMIFHMIMAVCMQYLEALRRPILVTAIMYAGVAINLVFDLALVVGMWGLPQMGAEGVAWATTGTRIFLAAVFIVVALVLTPALKASEAGPDNEGWRQIRVGIGSAVSNVAEWGGFNFTYVIATWISVATTAVYGLSIQVLGITFMLFLGIGTATSVRVAEAFGRRDMDGVKDASRLGIVATVLFGLGLGLLVFLTREPLAASMIRADAHIEGPGVIPVLSMLLAFAALVIVFDGLQGVASMALRAQEVVWTPAIIHLTSYFAVMLPLCWFFAIHLGHGARGMMEGVLISSILAGLAQTFWLERKTARRRSDTPSVTLESELSD